jgi:hypothetical protein
MSLAISMFVGFTFQQLPGFDMFSDSNYIPMGGAFVYPHVIYVVFQFWQLFCFHILALLKNSHHVLAMIPIERDTTL